MPFPNSDFSSGQITPGSFGVLAGTDGAGKQTQTKLLVERLQEEGVPVETISFPVYGTDGAHFLEQYLRTNNYVEHADQMHPELASLTFMVDRLVNGKPVIDAWREQGKVIISDRYVSGNKGHQLGKIKHPEERFQFLKWLDHMEYEVLGVPREDGNVLLYMPPVVSQRLAQRREGDNLDKHEGDLHHLEMAAGAYMFVAAHENWPIIHCLSDPEMSQDDMKHAPLDQIVRNRSDIHEEVYRTVCNIFSK